MHTIQIVHQSIALILSSIDQIIDSIQLHKLLPLYLQNSICRELAGNLVGMEPNYQLTNHILKQQQLSAVPLLSPDSLMPKHLQQQKQISPSHSKTNHSSFFKPIHKRIINNSLQLQNNKSKKSIISKKKNQQQLFPIKSIHEQINDPQFQNIIIKKELVVKEDEKYRDEMQKRNSQFIEKTIRFQQSFRDKEYTYEFDGSVLDTLTQQGILPYHSMKMHLGKISRNNNKEDYQSTIVEKSLDLPSRKRETNYQDNIKYTENIPLFTTNATNKGSFFNHPSNMISCNKEQFKKYYGGKFHRIDRSLMNTIDVTQHKQTNPDEQLFNSHRVIKESDSIKQSLHIHHVHANTRKLALPKLKGIYKVLDRYEGCV